MFGKRKSGGVYETENKRIKLDPEIEDKLSTVRDQLEKSNVQTDACCVMLESMAPGCLGPAMDERDELQTEGVDMIGKVIYAIEEEATEALRKADLICKDPEAAKQQLQKAKEEASKSKEKDEANRKEKQRAAERAKEALARANDMLRKANDVLSQQEAKQQKKKEEKEMVEDAFKEHFVPLRDGTWSKESEARGHFLALAPIFGYFNYEASLVAAFDKASKHKPGQRKTFDEETVRCAAFNGKIAGIDKQIQANIGPINQATEAVKMAERARAAAREQYKDALAELGSLSSRLRKWLAGLFAAGKELQDFPQSPQEALQRREAAREALESLQGPEGAVSAYEYLRDRVLSPDAAEPPAIEKTDSSWLPAF